MQKQMSKRFSGRNLNGVLLIIAVLLVGAIVTAAIATLIDSDDASDGAVQSAVQVRSDVERQGEGRMAEFGAFLSVPDALTTQDAIQPGEGRLNDYESFTSPSAGSWMINGQVAGEVDELVFSDTESLAPRSAGSWMIDGQVAGEVDELPALADPSIRYYPDTLYYEWNTQLPGDVGELPALADPAIRYYPDTLFYEWNTQLPGDVGTPNFTVLTTEEIKLLEDNLWLPEAMNTPSQPRVGFNEY